MGLLRQTCPLLKPHVTPLDATWHENSPTSKKARKEDESDGNEDVQGTARREEIRNKVMRNNVLLEACSKLRESRLR